MKTIPVINSLLHQLVLLLFEYPLFCRVSKEQREKLTEILVHGISFSIPNGAEFAAFTMCLTFIWFPRVNRVKPSVSIVDIPSTCITAVDEKINIRQRKTFCFIHHDILLAMGTKDCDWPACLSKVNNKSQHSTFIWDPSRFYMEAQKFHL